MGNGVLRYKGYYAKPAYDPDDQIIYGKILGISDLVDFYTETAKDVESEFHKAVDEYLEFCKEIGKEPQKSYSGSFNVRTSEELHREASICAQTNGMTLNAFVVQAIKRAVEQEDIVGKVCKTAAIMVTASQKYNIPQAPSFQEHPQFEVANEVNEAWKSAMKSSEYSVGGNIN